VKQKRKQTFKKSQESQSSLTTAEQSLAKAQSKAQTKRITIIAPGGMPLKVNPGQTFIVNKDPAKPSIEIEDTEAKCMAAELHERLNGPGIMTPPRLRPETAGPRKRTGPKRDPEVAKRRVIVDKCSEKDLGVCKNLDFEGCKPPSGWGGRPRGSLPTKRTALPCRRFTRSSQRTGAPIRRRTTDANNPNSLR